MPTAFQDRMPGNHCFGCGPGNERGLRIKSHWADEQGTESVCRFEPQPHQAAGPREYLNGGIIATVIDCHGVCTAIADAYRREGREMGQGELIWYVTGSLTVDYRRPTPIDREVEIRARLREVDGRKIGHPLAPEAALPGPVTVRLRALYKDLIARETVRP